MAFEIYIDDQLTDQPMNDMDLVTKIVRDDTISGVAITQDVVLKWEGNNAPVAGTISAYSYLKSLFDAGLCSEATINIYDRVSNTQTNLKHKGVIKLIQLEFSEHEPIVSTRIQDNNFYSYINNNRDLKVDLRATLTKNGEELDPIDFYTVDMFNGCVNLYGSTAGAYYKGYLISDIFTFIISAITDNKVSFSSSYLDNLTYPLMLFKGQSLVNSFTLYPTAPDPVFEISFQKIFDEINFHKNLYWKIDTSDPNAPVLVMEEYEASFTAGTGFEITEPKNIKTTVDQSTLYGKVVVGNTVTVDGVRCPTGIYTMNEAISYYGFKQEEFFPLGQCNNATELRLVNEWIASNNVIQDMVVGLSTSYMDDYVLVECEQVLILGHTAIARGFDFFGQVTPPVFYNLGLNNMSKLQRHSSRFETTFGNFLGHGTDGFKALLGDTPAQDITYMTGSIFNPNFIPVGGLTVDSEFVNETTNGGYDGSGNYNNVTFEYVVPADGDYSFHQRIHFEVDDLTGLDDFQLQATVTQYDSGLTQKAEANGGAYAPYNGFFYADATLVANCVAGDIIKASYFMIYSPNQSGNQQLARTLTVIWDSFFECNGTPDAGVTPTAGNSSVRKLIHDLEYPISETDWNTYILPNPTGMIPFTKDGVTRYGWIKELTRSDQTGIAKIKLMSSNATS